MKLILLRFRRTTIIMWGLAAFLAGLGLARTGYYTPGLLVLWMLLPLVAFARRKSVLTIIAVVLFGLAVGWWRGSAFHVQLEPYNDLVNEDVVIIAKVESDTVYSYQGQLSFDVGSVRFVEPIEQTVPGKIAVKGYGETALYRGDTLRITGRLSSTRGSRQARVSFSQFKMLSRNKSKLEEIRRAFVAGMQTALPEPQASFALGLLMGYRTTLPENTSEALKKVGLTHIIAVSGYNLTVIVRAVKRGLRNLSKYQQVVLSGGLIMLFLMVTDFSASIVRASIVSGLSLGAWYYGRNFRPLLILLLSGVMTTAWNPLYLWSDIGWYLSFLAFFGVLILAPLLARKLYKGKNKPSILASILLETTAAQLLTAPLALYIFSQTSSVSLISNLIISPLVPVVMVLALVAALGGMLVPILSGWIALPAWLLLTYMLDMVTVMSKIPNALVEHSVSRGVMLALYALVLAITTLLWNRAKKEHGKITEYNIV